MPAASHAADNSAPLPMDIRARLSVMMFLQYFVWGAWFVTLSSYLLQYTGKPDDAGILPDGKFFTPGFIGIAYGTAAIGGMIAPFFVGMIADRFFSSERILAVLHLAGAGLLYYISTIRDQQILYFALIGYFICYMPTLALTNSLSFHHLPRPDKQFPGIRVLGTIGWIVAGQLIGYHLKLFDGNLTLVSERELDPNVYKTVETTGIPMVLAAVGQAILGLYCVTLPHTPPKNRGHKVTLRDVLGLDALGLLRRPAFAVFVVGSFLIAIPLQFYYNYANGFLKDIKVPNPAGLMTWGQISEIGFMLLIPLLFLRLGVKYMLLIGMACWAIRYTLFAYGAAGPNVPMLLIGILLHGICYDFFFVTGQMYVDREADSKIRGAAQGFIAFVTLGVGSFIGANLSGLAEKSVTIVTRSGDTVVSKIHWDKFWLYPAAGAAAVMVLFAVSFFDHPSKSETAPR